MSDEITAQRKETVPPTIDDTLLAGISKLVGATLIA